MDKLTATEATSLPLSTRVIYRLLMVGPKQTELMSSGQKSHLILAFPHFGASLTLFHAPGPPQESLQRKVSPTAKTLHYKTVKNKFVKFLNRLKT